MSRADMIYRRVTDKQVILLLEKANLRYDFSKERKNKLFLEKKAIYDMLKGKRRFGLKQKKRACKVFMDFIHFEKRGENIEI